MIGGTGLSFKKVSILSILLLLLVTSPVLANEAIIDVNNLNVRSGPGTEYEPIGQVNQGEKHKILEENEEWIKIKFNDMEGWITKEFITSQGNGASNKEAEQPIEKPTITTITIQDDDMHLREGASIDFDIVAFAEKGQTYDVLSETENWLEISDGKIKGFVLRDNIEATTNTNDDKMQNKTIVIDPGHGGRDVGAIGVNGSYEKEITYLTAHELAKELTALGAEVILTRQEDEFIPLESRTTLANALATDAFISIHYNSFPEVPSVTGIETFYYHDQYEVLAGFVHQEIIKEIDEKDRGVTFDDFHVTRQTFKPGILLELGFLSNEESESLLLTTGYQKKIVTGIINGLQKYFALNP